MLLSSALAALALLQTSPVMIVGPGADSCGQWTQARQRRDGSDVAYLAWLAGYLSGANQWGAGDVLAGRRVTDAALWVDGYCRDNPMVTVKRAGDALVGHLLSS